MIAGRLEFQVVAAGKSVEQPTALTRGRHHLKPVINTQKDVSRSQQPQLHIHQVCLYNSAEYIYMCVYVYSTILTYTAGVTNTMTKVETLSDVATLGSIVGAICFVLLVLVLLMWKVGRGSILRNKSIVVPTRERKVLIVKEMGSTGDGATGALGAELVEILSEYYQVDYTMWMEMEIRRKGITKWVVDHVGSYDHTIMMLSSPGVMDLHHSDQLLNCVNNFVRTSSTTPIYLAFTPHHRVSGINVLVLPTDLNLLWKRLGLKMKREKTLRFKKMMTSA